MTDDLAIHFLDEGGDRLIEKENAQERERESHRDAVNDLASVHCLGLTRFLNIRTTGKLNPFVSGTSERSPVS